MRILIQKNRLLFVQHDLSVESHEIEADPQWLFGATQCAAAEWLARELHTAQLVNQPNERMGAAKRLQLEAEISERLGQLRNDPRFGVAVELLRKFPTDGYEYVGDPLLLRKMTQSESEAVAFIDFRGQGCGWPITDLMELRKT